MEWMQTLLLQPRTKSVKVVMLESIQTYFVLYSNYIKKIHKKEHIISPFIDFSFHHTFFLCKLQITPFDLILDNSYY